ncbi:MAG TPA: hydantoinase/oxoprolinase family protein [Candidatus Saccharimonadales bacterium]|nr:hydantoinase/oxoprolinase family protein [Candidatus Saccharimonadales bacterium]
MTAATAAGRPAYRVGVDIGGTFTDIVLVGGGEYRVKKLLSTPDNYAVAVVEGIRSLLMDSGLDPASIDQVAHATTVATNAVLERRGARTGLLTTRGFRDVLELRRIRFPDPYNLNWRKPAPLVPRRWRLEVDERIGADGAVVTPIDLGTVELAVQRLAADGVESIAICFLNSYANPTHEQAARALIRDAHPRLNVSISAEVLPEIKEFERTSTAVVNAYVQPVLAGYLSSLRERLHDIGVRAPIHVMQSNGGMMTVKAAVAYPVYALESGPAAGVIGAARIARRTAARHVVTFDMGGTTAKAAAVEDGQAVLSSEYEVGAPISLASRVLKGGGYLLRIPSVDVVEVGAGGGSIVSLDAWGRLLVGPQSAGSVPGPACYGRGGTSATVTDANLVLGYLGTHGLAGTEVALDHRAAVEALRPVASAIGVSVEDAALGIVEVVNATMSRAIRAVMTSRGQDVRESRLIAFGGSGAVHAAGLAESLGIRQVIIPPSPGVFSAYGLLTADLARHFVKTLRLPTDRIEPRELLRILHDFEREVIAEVEDEGWDRSRVSLARTAELHYWGQWHELEVDLPDPHSETLVTDLVERFKGAYVATYGHAHVEETIELVNLRIRATVAVEQAPPPEAATAAHGRDVRRAYFRGLGWRDMRLTSREQLALTPQRGPLAMDEYDTTILVPPGLVAGVDVSGNLIMELTDAT